MLVTEHWTDIELLYFNWVVRGFGIFASSLTAIFTSEVTPEKSKAYPGPCCLKGILPLLDGDAVSNWNQGSLISPQWSAGQSFSLGREEGAKWELAWKQRAFLQGCLEMSWVTKSYYTLWIKGKGWGPIGKICGRGVEFQVPSSLGWELSSIYCGHLPGSARCWSDYHCDTRQSWRRNWNFAAPQLHWCWAQMPVFWLWTVHPCTELQWADGWHFL